MRRATITLPDDLEAELDSFLEDQDAAPSLTAVVQAALRRYLEEQRLAAREYRAPKRPLRVTPAEKGSGGETGAEDHDRHLAASS